MSWARRSERKDDSCDGRGLRERRAGEREGERERRRLRMGGLREREWRRLRRDGLRDLLLRRRGGGLGERSRLRRQISDSRLPRDGLCDVSESVGRPIAGDMAERSSRRLLGGVLDLLSDSRLREADSEPSSFFGAEDLVCDRDGGSELRVRRGDGLDERSTSRARPLEELGRDAVGDEGLRLLGMSGVMTASRGGRVSGD